MIGLCPHGTPDPAACRDCQLTALREENERLKSRVRTICQTYAEPCTAVVCTGDAVHIHGTAEEVADFLLAAALSQETPR